MNKRSRSILIAAVAVAGLATLAASASAYEEPSYEVIAQDGDFELRRYAPYLVAQTTVTGHSEQASNEAFMRLFRYISGKSRRQVRPDDPKVAMTIPVTMDFTGGSTTMTFMVPEQYSLETAPRPADPAVELREMPGGLVAALSYGGRSSRDRFLERKKRLLEWAADRELEAVAEPVFAQYNGPFTPWFLRRNEVLMVVNNAG